MIKFIKKKIQHFSQSKDNVYIIPSKKGFKYVFINFSLFIIAMAYTNNMALLISFIAFAYFILQMLETHKIIQELQIEEVKINNEYYGREHLAYIKLKKSIQSSFAKYVHFSFENSHNEIHAHFKKQLNESYTLFSVNIPKRGQYTTPRIKFFTTGTTGMFYVWRYYRKGLTFYSYPEKKYISKRNLHNDLNSKLGFNEVEFHTHIPYTQGMNSKRIDWKIYARSEMLFWKKHIDHHSTVYDVNYSHFQGNKEERLSYMSFLIDKYQKDSKQWRLTLPNKIIKSNSGAFHYSQSMEAISVY